jgi:hypothetical protein
MSKNSFHMVLLPKAPLLGIQILNNKFLDEDQNVRDTFGIEIGLLFFRFSFMRILD